MNNKSDLTEPAKTPRLVTLSVLLVMITVGFACSHKESTSAPSAPSSAPPTSPAPIVGKVNREIDSKLLSAAESGDVKQVKAMLDAGADIEAREELYGRTPLMEATIAGKASVVAELLERGSAVDAKDTISAVRSMFALPRCGRNCKTTARQGATLSLRTMKGIPPRRCRGRIALKHNPAP